MIKDGGKDEQEPEYQIVMDSETGNYSLIIGKKNPKENVGRETPSDMTWSDVDATPFHSSDVWDNKSTISEEGDFKYYDLDEILAENYLNLADSPSDYSTANEHDCTNFQKSNTGFAVSPIIARDNMAIGANNAIPIATVLPNSHHVTTVTTKQNSTPMSGYQMQCSPTSSTTSTLSYASPYQEFHCKNGEFSNENRKGKPGTAKKPKKMFIPDGLKDDKYWARRKKNNIAAKRSRDARRMKESQIAFHASILEKENIELKQEIERLKKENIALLNGIHLSTVVQND